MSNGLITIFGGSGFLGRYLVKRLAAAGRPLRIASRDPEAALFLRPMGKVGQVELVAANVRDEASVARAVRGAAAVVNLVGILEECRRQTFQAVHADGAERVARAARDAGATAFLHVSSVAADASGLSNYAKSKAAGEARVRAAFPDAVVVRPSIVFGPEDDFLNRFGALARLSPVLPVFGGGEGPQFQPVYVGDVAEAMARVLQHVDSAGKTFEFGGPDIFTLRQILRLVLQATARRRPIVGLPWPVASLAAAATALLPMPKPLRITGDQVRQLHRDTVVSDRYPGLAALGIAPTPMATLVPMILARYRRVLDNGSRPLRA